MARVVLVHGIGKQYRGENGIRQDWVPALQEGLVRAGSPGLLRAEDTATGFYGDLYRQPAALTDPIDDLGDLDDASPGLETDLLVALWREAARTDPKVEPVPEPPVPTPPVPTPPAPEPPAPASGADRHAGNGPWLVSAAVRALHHAQYFDGLSRRAIVFDLRQITRYLTDEDLRTQARQRVAEAVGTDTVAVVAHSLGAVVAYEALCSVPGHGVRAFITLGCPLGAPDLILNRLRPAPVGGTGAWPGSAGMAWTNVADAQDIMALVKDLASAFGPGVRTHQVRCGSHSQDARRYLATFECGYALAEALEG